MSNEIRTQWVGGKYPASDVPGVMFSPDNSLSNEQRGAKIYAVIARHPEGITRVKVMGELSISERSFHGAIALLHYKGAVMCKNVMLPSVGGRLRKTKVWKVSKV